VGFVARYRSDIVQTLAICRFSSFNGRGGTQGIAQNLSVTHRISNISTF